MHSKALALTALATAAAYPLDAFIGVSNLTLVFLAAVLISALTRGLWSGLLTGIICALAYNWFYTEPRYTFTVADPGERARHHRFLRRGHSCFLPGGARARADAIGAR